MYGLNYIQVDQCFGPSECECFVSDDYQLMRSQHVSKSKGILHESVKGVLGETLTCVMNA